MKHQLIVNKTAHYYYEPAIGSSKGLVLAVHGYAQLAVEFSDNFKELPVKGYELYVPEALSKFYNKERQPVASWMTSYEREDEISDYINYLETLMQLIIQKNVASPIHLIGFSQGVSTLLRWYASSKLKAATVHLIAGSIPEELSSNDIKQLIADKYFYYHGTKDRLVKEDQVNKYLGQLAAIGIDYEKVNFEGRHEVPMELIKVFTTL